MRQHLNLNQLRPTHFLPAAMQLREHTARLENCCNSPSPQVTQGGKVFMSSSRAGMCLRVLLIALLLRIQCESEWGLASRPVTAYSKCTKPVPKPPAKLPLPLCRPTAQRLPDFGCILIWTGQLMNGIIQGDL